MPRLFLLSRLHKWRRLWSLKQQFSIFEGKVGVAVGITNELTKKYDAVNLVKIASKVLGGKGGGGRKDFAQAGGIKNDKIKDAFKAVSEEIN